MFCKHCGKEVNENAVMCVGCGCSIEWHLKVENQSTKTRTAYIVLGLFLGVLGVHNFYAGYIGKGVAQIMLTLLFFFLIFPIFIVWIWNMIEICTVTKDANGENLQ